mgnify:CR=1 FL=1
MHDDHPPNKPAGQLETAPRIRRLKCILRSGFPRLLDSSAHTEIKSPRRISFMLKASTAPRIRRLKVPQGHPDPDHHDSSAHTEIKIRANPIVTDHNGQLRAYGD